MREYESQLSILEETWKAALKPPSTLNPWQWAESNLYLPSQTGTAHPGYYSSAITPYVRGVMEEYQNPHTRHMALCFSAQSGKTMTEIALLAYTIEEDPGPTGFVLPSQDFAISFSTQRIQPVINFSPILAKHKLASGHMFKNLEMTLDNMTIFLMWAGSATQLSSRALKNLFRDEVDKWPGATSSEADPLSLSEERTKTYSLQKKIVDSSTPTTEDGYIWQALHEFDFRQYHVPCIHCGKFFVIKWDCIRWDNSLPAEKLAKSAHCVCSECGGRIEENHKYQIIEKGQWIGKYKDKDPSKASFHLSEMYSPWSTWGDLALKFKAARRKAKIGIFDGLQNFVNSSLAEPWTAPVENQKRDEDVLRLRDGRPAGLVPRDALLLTAGIDTQDNGFWYIIRAWGEDVQSWLIREGFVLTLSDLDRVLFEDQYFDVDGHPYVIARMAIDAMGHRTAEIYDYCRRRRGIMAAKGELRMTNPHKISKIDTYPGTDKPIPGGLNLLRHNTTYYKDMLSTKMMVPPADPGAFLMHSEIGGDYIKHMTAEYKNEKGYWDCPNGKANHLWDCEELALVAADFDGIRYAKKKVNPYPADYVAPKKQPPEKRGSGKSQKRGMMY